MDETEILLARSLFRVDKWSPARDPNGPFEWDQLRADYLDKARRLLRTFEKDGLSLSVIQPAVPETAG